VSIKQKRFKKFLSLKEDTWYSKHYAKLTAKDLKICHDFLDEFGASEEYGKHVNRIFVENFRDRKQNTTKDSRIWELLSLCYKV